ncbi:pantetheine-phosphate adenylyltransferase [Natrinema hispanicum]|uniref:Pantetheine-phosphate adenylyltransferase n=2 Tax=Natrinema hispanicum TaxID=392421 RepID=A0A1G6TRS5_9EURY|nr:pantetheine-phosphate adenylyltransferase [Natrinema hispanicum]SES99286.1 pantetheine-phosphate adenylyltransferase [Natrinema hispanicum]
MDLLVAEPCMRVVVAGTFGPLHDGHRFLFEHALRFGADGVVVALTSDDLATETRHEPRPIPSFDERVAAVTDAISDLDKWDRDVEIRRLETEPGIAATDPAIDALVVSPETAPELEDINDQRRAHGLEPLSGIVAPYVYADDGERISSTRIVNGEIDEHGRVLE